MTQTFFSIPIFIDHTHVKSKKYIEMVDIFTEYKHIIKTQEELKKIRKQLGREYYHYALSYLRTGEWWKEDLV